MGIVILSQDKFKAAKTIAEKKGAAFVCRACGKPFTEHDRILSKQAGGKTKYYHKECYLKLWR
jgi:hypothetical protein